MKPKYGFLGGRRGLAGGPPPGRYRVNLGCGGSFHPDWVNFDFVASSPDVIRHDLRRRLPLDDASCAVVYHSHVLEHFPRAFAPLFLRECHRILTPGGLLRVVVPDLETIARLYLQTLEGALAGDAGSAHRHEWMTLELLDQMVREESGGEMLTYWKQNPMPVEGFVIERMGREVLQFIQAFRARASVAEPAKAASIDSYQAPKPADVTKFRDGGEVHKWMYDRWSLSLLLEGAGFHEVKVCAAGESQIPDFANYHLELAEDGSVRKPDSLFMEATRK